MNANQLSWWQNIFYEIFLYEKKANIDFLTVSIKVLNIAIHVSNRVYVSSDEM